MRLRGELDLATAPVFERTLRAALDTALLVIVDLRELTFMDGAGLHVIVRADTRAREIDRRLLLIRQCGQIDRLLKLVGIRDQLKIADVAPDLHAELPIRGHGTRDAAC